ncbi:MAG: ATP-binding protein [bacterium]|nr:ATP-binding protein [bacterium]
MAGAAAAPASAGSARSRRDDPQAPAAAARAHHRGARASAGRQDDGTAPGDEALLGAGVEPRRIFRVQCDDLPELVRLREPVLRLIDWYEATVLGETLNAAAHAGRPAYLFLDEVQNLRDWDVQLKHLVDSSALQAVVTGSSALRIERGRDSLAGRINTVEVGTLSLREVAAIRGFGTLETPLGDDGLEALLRKEFWLDLVASGRRQAAVCDVAFAAFADRGGYPLVHARADVPWPDVADQLNETVIRRVIRHDLGIGDRGRKRDPALLEELFRLACRYAGQAPTLELFAREAHRALQANVGVQRVRHDMDFLDATLLLRLVPPLEIGLKKRRGAATICLADHGLRASWLQEVVPLTVAGLAKHPLLADLAGHIAESIAGACLSTIGGSTWRTSPSAKPSPRSISCSPWARRGFRSR